MNIKWPEKRNTHPISNYDNGFQCGYTTAIDACKKAVEEAQKCESCGVKLSPPFCWKCQKDSIPLTSEEFHKQEPALVHLDIMAMRECTQEAVRKELNQTHSWKLIRIVCEAIYERFGTPKPRPVVTVGTIASLINKNRYVDMRYSSKDTHEEVITKENLLIAQAIVDYLNKQ